MAPTAISAASCAASRILVWMFMCMGGGKLIVYSDEHRLLLPFLEWSRFIGPGCVAGATSRPGPRTPRAGVHIVRARCA
jgi:hypothetical protein